MVTGVDPVVPVDGERRHRARQEDGAVVDVGVHPVEAGVGRSAQRRDERRVAVAEHADPPPRRRPQDRPRRRRAGEGEGAVILEVAQLHFRAQGVGTSLEAIAREAGVGAGTLYRHFPTREALLADVLAQRRRELKARREEIDALTDTDEALRAWMRAIEEYFGAFTGLPEPLMAAAQARDPDNPLTLPCEEVIATIDIYLRAAQAAGVAQPWVGPRDLFLSAISLAWVRGTSAADEPALAALRRIDECGYRLT